MLQRRRELVAALRANDSDAFRDLLPVGIQELGLTEVEELLLDWIYSFLTAQEQDRLWAPTLQREMGWAPEAGEQGHSS